MIFNTNRSQYEIDLEQKLIRRISGIRPPTKRQGQDGVWQPYLDASMVSIGSPVYVELREHEGFLTGTVRSIEC